MVKKIFFVILTTLLIFTFIYSNNIVKGISISNIITGAENFVNNGKEGAGNTINQQALSDTSDVIYNTLLIVGTGIAVLWGVILGIQFIIGSVEQKVKVKESLIPFVIGCIVIFSAFGIWRLVIIILR